MDIQRLQLKFLDGVFTVHRISVGSKISPTVYESNFFAVTKTDEELSIVCDSSIHVESEKSEAGWSCFKVVGPLDFSLTGVLAKLSTCLAEANISIFAISTYDTDYILVRTQEMERAQSTLIQAGYLLEK